MDQSDAYADAYEANSFKGRTYYECRLCCGDEAVVEMDEKDIVRHVFVEHVLKEEMAVASAATLAASSVADSPDASDDPNSGHSVQRTHIYSNGDHRSPPDQLNDDRQSVATKADQIRNFANRQSMNLPEARPVITGRPPAHTFGQSSSRRPRNDQNMITAAKHSTTRVPAAAPFAPTFHRSVSLTSNSSQPEFIVDTKRFPCLEKGCGKTFGFMQSLLLHRRKHTNRVDKTAANLTTKAITIPKATAAVRSNALIFDDRCHEWTYCAIPGYQRMGDKWFKVVKTDRSVNRHEKESYRHDHNYRGLCSLKHLKEWYECDPSGGQKRYRCLFEMAANGTVCPFHTLGSQRMARHLNLVHFRNRRFECRYCPKVFLEPNSKRVHEMNHRCGFGAGNGNTIGGPCGNRCIYKYKQFIIVDGVKMRECSLCGYTTPHRSIARHIHNNHLCPFRNQWFECSPPPGAAAAQDSAVSNILANIGLTGQPSTSALTANAINDDSNDFDDDFEIIDENIATDERRRRSRVSPEITEWLRAKNVMTCSTARYRKSMQELERLVRIRQFFDLRLVDGRNHYVCQFRPQECHFPATTLEYISIHLSGKHFVN